MISLILQVFLTRHCLNLYNYQKTSFENESLKIYSTQLESSYRLLQEFRHDYIGILSSLEYGIKKNDMELVKKVFYSTIQPSKDRVVASRSIFLKLSLLREDVKSFLVYKISDIISHKVKIELVVTTSLEDCEIESIDLIRILSILLDNAFEEADKDQNSFIKIMLISTPTTEEIRIINSIRDTNTPINEIFKKGFSTKDKHTGLGLYTVKKIISNYSDILLETSIEKSVINQKIIIPHKVRRNK